MTAIVHSRSLGSPRHTIAMAGSTPDKSAPASALIRSQPPSGPHKTRPAGRAASLYRTNSLRPMLHQGFQAARIGTNSCGQPKHPAPDQFVSIREIRVILLYLPPSLRPSVVRDDSDYPFARFFLRFL